MTRSDAPRWQIAALAALVVLYVAHAARYGAWLVDDAGITFAYAQNLAAGHGPVINVGEAPVEGYSNPSWTFLIALLYAVDAFSVPLVPKLLGGALNVLAMVLAWRTSRRAWGDPASAAHLLAPALMAGVPTFVKYTMSGLENALFVLTIVAALHAQLRERERGGWLGGLLTFLVVIGRPEGIAYALVFGVDRVAQAVRRRDASGLWKWAAALVGPLALYAAWHANTFADWLPNTYYAKVRVERGFEQVLSRHDGGNRYLREAFADHALYWAAALALLPVLAPRRWLDAGGLALYGALGVAVTFPLYSGGDWMPQHRLLSPMYPLLAIAAAGGFTAPLLARLPGRGALPVLATIGFAITIPAPLARAVATPVMRLDVQLETLSLFERWADQLGLDYVIVGLADVGGSSMTTTPRFELLDLNGLITREVAHRLQDLPEDGPEPLRDYVFREKRPHFLRYAEPIYKRYGLADYPAAREEWWLVNTTDAEERFGTYVRRDLVEGTLPEGVEAVPVGEGLRAAAVFADRVLTIWWAADVSFTANPVVALTWLDERGAPVGKARIKPYGGVFGWLLPRPGRVLREVFRGEVPEAAVAVTLGPLPDTRGAASAVAVPVPVEGAPAEDARASEGFDGTFEGSASAWTPIPPEATGWAVEPDGADHALRVDLAGEGTLVCGPWAPLPTELHVTGNVRGEGLTRGEKPWQTGAATLRVRRADGKQHFPVLERFEGTFAWRPFEARYAARPGDETYRLCVGSTGGAGRLWADDLVVSR